MNNILASVKMHVLFTSPVSVTMLLFSFLFTTTFITTIVFHISLKSTVSPSQSILCKKKNYHREEINKANYPAVVCICV